MNPSSHKQKSFKRHLANWLQRSAVLRWGLETLVTLLIPRHQVGAVGVVFNPTGQILLVEHVFRPHYNWGLPGGWVERGENPAGAVRRELEEELGLKIEVKSLLACEVQGGEPQGSTPVSLGLAYYCRLANNELIPNPDEPEPKKDNSNRKGREERKEFIKTFAPFAYFAVKLFPKKQGFDWLGTNTHYAFEILSTAWVDPAAITYKLTPLDHQVIALAQAEFERDRGPNSPQP